MQKKLLAAAVAGALVAPAAFAQSAVTISGYFKAGPDYVSYSGASGANAVTTTPVTRTQSNEWRMSDHSSRILFNVNEDLGSGLAAIAQLDVRFNTTDSPAVSSLGWGTAFGGGNTWVGLRSNSWGTLTFGRHDLHYGKAGDDVANKAGSLQLIASSIFDVVGGPVPGTAAAHATTVARGIASQSRTNNVMRWDSPNWNGFALTVAYSTNPLQVGGGGQNTEGDLFTSAVPGQAGTGPNTGTTISRRGRGWNFNPSYNAANWGVQWSHWDAKQDLNNSATTSFTQGAVGAVTLNAIQDDQKSDVLAGYFKFNAFKIGLAYNRSKTTSPVSGLVTGDRTAWSIPVTWTSGPHEIAAHYTRAGDSKDVTSATTGGTISGSGTGASMYAIAYSYSLSKRTSVGVSYGELRNKENAAYNFFYNAPSVFGSASSTTLAGEKVTLLSFAVRHNF